ncbi:MAG: tandem-95 repeat protein, partial [Planctomycetes bacterium]|nr:tandem-95 repeat protein [Planctomycetota bacterium]
RFTYTVDDGLFVSDPATVTITVNPHRIISGILRHDVNEDALFDDAEPRLPGWTIYLDLNQNGRLDANEPSTVTLDDHPATPGENEAGRYSLVDEPPGEYTIAVATKPGWGTSAPDLFAPPEHYRVPYASGDDELMFFYYVISEDFDGDGDLDLALTDWDYKGAIVMLNRGDGSFATPRYFPTPDHAGHLAAADFDGDGDTDLVVAQVDTDSVSVMLNDGDGRFFWQTQYGTGDHPVWVVVGDLDGDGDQDLAVANRGSEDVTVLLNDGGGSFTAGGTFAAGEVYNMAMGDVDGDGDLDLVGHQWVLLNDGNGSFTPGEGHYEPTSYPHQHVALGDLDDDGDLDLAMTTNVSHSSALAILLNRGDGSFEWTGSYVVGSDSAGDGRRVLQVVDFDRDGDLDLVSITQDDELGQRPHLVLMRNRGDGSLAATEFFQGPGMPVHATSGDFDGDGAPDVFILGAHDYQGPLSFYRNIWPYRLTLTPGGVIEDVDFGVHRVPPLAVDDEYEVNEGETLAVAAPGTLGNDVYELNSVPDVSRDTDPTHGQLTLNTDGSFTYTPEPGFVGVDTFTYTADDGQFTSNVGTVSINVKPWSTIRGTVWNDLDGSQFQEAGEPGLQAWQVFLDGNQNGTHELGELIAASDSLGNYELASVRSGTHTVVQLLKPAWEQTSPSGSHSVVLGAGQTEEDIDFGSRRVPPTAVDDQYHVDENQDLAVPGPGVLTNDVYDLDLPPVVELQTEPIHGSVTLAPDGSFLYSPEAGFFGPDSFTYVARDLPADSNVATVGIMVGGPSIIAGSVWSDQNRNLLRDPGESSLEGWTVELHAGAGNYLRTFQKPAPAEDDRFGSSIATLNGNVIVGAQGDSTGAPRAGAVYMFDGSTGELLRTLLNPTPENDDMFGGSVAVVGGNVLVGARFVASGDHDYSGEAYLFDGSTGALLHTFSNPDPLTYSNFGSKVAVVGEKIFISAQFTLPISYPGARAGAVHMYDASTRAFVRTFHHPDPSNYDNFGSSTADVNGNVLIGSKRGAFLFDPNTGDLLHTFVEPPGTPPQSRFGVSAAAVSGNILIGAPQQDVGGKDSSGAAYLFDGSTYELLHTFLNPTPASHEYFGKSFAEVEGDVVIASCTHPAFGGYSGEVFVFDGATRDLLETYVYPGPGSGRRSEFGSRVAALGDKLLVAAEADNVGAPDAGAVYFFPRACRTTVTDALGRYHLTGVEPGTYEVRQVVEEGYSPTFPGGDGGHVVVIGEYEMVTDLDFASCFEEPPVAEDDGYRMHADTTLSEVAAGLLDNDTDPNTDALTAVLVDHPSHGTLALDGDGSFRYAPQAGFVGADHFTYLAHDGRLGSNVATVTITVETGRLEPIPFYFSLQNGGTVGGRKVANEDIVVYDGFRFRRYFDGSDVGLGDLAIDAVAVMSENEILMSFAEAGAVPGIADTVEASDLVKFTATRLGKTTAGTFELFFDGSDVGLVAKGINVDAVEMLEDGRLLFSVASKFDVVGISGADEDLSLFTPTSLGPTTAGTWAQYFDGSDVGLTSENVDAVAMDDHGDLLLSTNRVFSALGLAGEDEDLFVFRPTSLGPVTSGSYAPGLYFDGSQYGLSANDLSAVDLVFNRPPVAVAETYHTPVNGVLRVAAAEGVLTNDSDPDGDSMKAVLVDAPSHGTLILGVDGSFVYVPQADFLGIDEFTYWADDGRLASNLTTVNLVVPELLGRLSFRELNGQHPSAGDIWYQCTPTHDAFLTLEAMFAAAAGTAQLTLYDENLAELATSTLVGGNQRIDRQVGAGEMYFFKLSGTSGDVDLRLANLVSHVGTKVTVYGTVGADSFEFDPAASRLVTINGVEYHFEDTEVTSATFNGRRGDDVALLHGDPNGPNRFEAWPGRAKLSGDDYTVWAISVRYVHAYANRGPADVALLHGDPNGPNQFEAWPHRAKLCGDDYLASARSFRYVHAYANQGPADVALLHGDPAGPNRFEAWPDQAKLRGDDYFVRAKAFRYVHAYANQGPLDVALLHGDPNGPNRFESWPDQAK